MSKDGGGRSGLGGRINVVCDLVGGRKALARAIGVSDSQLQRYASEENQPPLESLLAISDASGVTLDWLAAGKGAPFRHEHDVSQPALTELECAVLRSLELFRRSRPQSESFPATLAGYVDAYNSRAANVDHVKGVELLDVTELLGVIARAGANETRQVVSSYAHGLKDASIVASPALLAKLLTSIERWGGHITPDDKASLLLRAHLVIAAAVSDYDSLEQLTDEDIEPVLRLVAKLRGLVGPQ